MIAISMITINSQGTIVIKNTSKCSFGKIPARVVRTPTLDGGAHIGHYGVSQGDRTFNIIARLSREDVALFRYIYENSIYIFAAIDEGLFLGVISEFDDGNGLVNAKILIKQKEN